MQVASLEFQMAADIARMASDIRKAEGLVDSAAQRMQRTFDTLGRGLGGVFAGLSVGAMAAWIKSAIDAGDEANKMAQKMGVATKEVAGLELAYRLSGAGSEAMATSVARLAKQVSDGSKALEAMGIRTRGASGELRGTTDVLYEVADVFKELPDGIGKTALAVETFGRSGADLIPLLNGGSEGFREMAAMAARLALVIDEETGKRAEAFNDTLDLIGMGTRGISRGIAAELLPTLQSLAGNFLASMTEGDKLKRTADILATALKGLYVVGLGTAEVFSTVGKYLGGTWSAIALATRGEFRMAAEALRVMANDVGDGWSKTARSISQAWGDESGAALAAAAQVGKVQRDLLADQKAREEAAKAAAAAAQKEADALAKLMAKLNSKDAGIDADFIDNMQLLYRGWQRGAVGLADYLKKAEQLVRMQPYMVKHEKEVMEAAQEVAALRKADYDAAQKGIDAIRAEQLAAEQSSAAAVQAAQDEYHQRGMLASQIVEITMLRNLDKMALLDADGEAAKSLQKVIDNQRTLVDILRRGEAREAMEQQAREQLQQQVDLWSRIESVARDTFVSIFDSGKSAFDRLRDTLKNGLYALLYEMTAKRWLVSIGTSMGVPGAAMAAQSGAGSMFSGLASSTGSLGAFGSAASGVAQGVFLGAGELSSLGFMEALSGGFAAVAEGSIAAGLGTLAGVLGPIAAAAAIIASFVKDRGGPKVDGTFGYTVSDIGSAGTTRALDQATMQAAQSLQAQFEAITKALGTTTGVRFGMGVSTDPAGDSPTFLDVTASRDGAAIWHVLNRNVGRTQEELQAAMTQAGAQALIGALQGVSGELPQTVQRMLAGVNVGGLSQEGAAEIASRIMEAAAAVAQFGKVAEALPFERLRNLGFDAAAGLIEASGGLDALTGNLATYYDLFFSEEEKRANTARAIAEKITTAGLAMTQAQVLAAASAQDAAQQFRALTESLDPTSGLYAALISVAGAFAGITTKVDTITATVDDLTTATTQFAAEVQKVKLADVVGMFLSPAENQYWQASKIASQFNGQAGTALTPEFVLGLDAAEFRGYFQQFMDEGNTVLTDAMLQVAQAFMTLQGDIYAAGATLRSLEAEEQSLNVQILQALGKDEEAKALIRTIETAGMTPKEIEQWDKNRLREEELAGIIKAANEAAEAERLLEQRRQQQATAARQLAETWSRMGDTLMQEVYRLRGAIASADPQQSLSFAWSQFTSANMSARAGNLTAAGQLPGLSQAVEQAAMLSAGSLAELNTVRAQLASSLEGTATFRSPNAEVVEAVGAVRAETRALREETASLRSEVREANKKIEQHTRATANTIELWDKSPGGLTVTVAD
jgi:hypothetical protein